MATALSHPAVGAKSSPDLSPVWVVVTFLATVFVTSSLWILLFIAVERPTSNLVSTLLNISVKPIVTSPLFYILLFRPLALRFIEHARFRVSGIMGVQRNQKEAVEIEINSAQTMHALDEVKTGLRQFSPLRLLLVLTITVFMSETMVMVALPMFPHMPGWMADLLDASLLVAMLMPAFYFFVYSPLADSVNNLERVNRAKQIQDVRLRSMLDNLPYLAWLKDAEGRYLAVNEPFAIASGKKSSAEVLGKSSVEVCPEWMLERYYEGDQEIMVSGKQSHVEILVHEHGQERWLEIFRNPVRDSQGKLLGISGFSRDITERKQAEGRLRLSAKIFESGHDAILVTDAEASIVSVNPAFTELTGYSEEDVIGQNPRILASGNHSKEFFAQMWNKLGKKGYWSGEVWNRKKNGELYMCWLSIRVLRDPAGNVTHYIGVTSDITEHRRAEEQLRLAAKVLESSHDSIIITDTSGAIILVNPAFTEITGYIEDDVIGKNPRLLNSGKQSREFYAEMWNSLLQNGYWNGEVWNRRKDGGMYAGRLSINALRDESGRVTHYVGVTSDITEYKMAHERVRHLAYYDQLTGLPNASMVRDRVNQLVSSAHRDHREFSLVFLDLDNFKNVNNSLGHHVGDLLLQTIAGRLRSAVREQDTVARFGGDEFVVLLPDVGVEGAERVARKIIGQVTNSYGIKLHKINMTTSMGISVFPKDGTDVDVLMKNAELALYRAKARGRNNYAFFTEEMNVLARERMQMETDLRHALLNEDLVLYYQPQISLATRELIGMEALVRWQHPQLGMIPPDQFIPIAEESDMIIELGEWAMHEACRQLREWQRHGLQTVPVAVNVSARQMKDEEFPDIVSSILRKTGVDPSFLELELTERAVMADMELTVETMNRVGELGVKFAVDDFGTGYSSLSYLRHLPLDKLKIDKSFVQDLATEESDREISNSVIQLAHNLQLSVVAEGVETQQQMAILLGQGCDGAQGYLFGRPMPPHEFAAFLHASRTA
jgi:diguanylate cyclase (GGDEF)-like protein/PAS domain S-box-containing protein